VLDLESASSLDEALLSPAYVQDPYPVLARLRTSDPVYWLDPWRMWLVTRYHDVQEVLRHDGTLWSAVGQTSAALAHLPPDQRAELSGLERLFSAGLLWSDPPDHTRIRAVVNKAMRPRDAEAMRPRIHGIVAGALDQIEEYHGEGAREPFDLVAEFAALIPVTVLAELLGIPPADVPRFRAWADTLAAFLGSPRPSLELARTAQDTVLETREFIDWLAAERRDRPADDAVSRLVAARHAGAALSDDEFHATLIVLLVGGHRTTSALIGNAVLALLRHPEAFRGLRQGRVDIAAAVEEFLRYDSPHQRTIRIAREDTRIAEQPIAAGEVVALLNGAANRDSEQFEDPDELRLDRSPNKHLTLSAGIHFCIGAPLARIEGAVAIGAFLARFPDLELLEDPPVWLENHTLRTLTRLRLRLRLRAA
jgi:cytochrome P450